MQEPSAQLPVVECDVLVIGSGAGAMLAANRAHDLGLRVMVIERSDRYGGTTALSGGGMWIPCNKDNSSKDSRAAARQYIQACSEGRVPDSKIDAYLDSAPAVIDYMGSKLDMPCHAAFRWADYRQHLPGAVDGGRTMFVDPIDGASLGEEFYRMREAGKGSQLMGRLTLSIEDASILGGREKGWKRHLIKLMAAYWLDIGWRRKTSRDRRLAMGQSLVAGLRRGLLQRGVPLQLNTRFVDYLVEQGRVVGAQVSHDGQLQHIRTGCGVIAAAGGFEQSQALRDRYLPVPTQTAWTVTVPHNNVGDTLLAGLALGADADLLEHAWWCPSVRLPAMETPNVDVRAGLFAERSYPHSLIVNRTGRRFANEAMSYHDFGIEMVRDQQANGTNLPCWMVFDAQYRAKSQLGTLMPSSMQPDSKLPREWWDAVIYRADTVEQLADKIGVPKAALAETVERFNGFARTGIDTECHRGKYSYDNVYCDDRHGPSPTLGTLEKGPFYAVRVDLGDLGTLGGLKTDEHGQVLHQQGHPIEGLFAIGNSSASVMGGSYPGAGSTLGPAVAFGYRAANRLAELRNAQR